ncbi:hypothetical protein Y032_0105g3665 [Ancylostoma ceylanicum]|uniref:Uncharacterized protein n=1 Tax=Ancylostoma ceylanicum TaxID=53326 RepID=A0A016TG52_9BILA|nr:hypothetical protein Y032_0105g3665 [Ancylostoma ceylanicum]
MEVESTQLVPMIASTYCKSPIPFNSDEHPNGFRIPPLRRICGFEEIIGKKENVRTYSRSDFSHDKQGDNLNTYIEANVATFEVVCCEGC